MLARVAILVFATAVALPASAATPDAKDIRFYFADYAKCIVSREPDLSRRFALGEVRATAGSPEYRRLIQRECVDLRRMGGSSRFIAQMRTSEAVFRGAIANEIVVRDSKWFSTLNFASAPPLPKPAAVVNSSGKPGEAVAVAPEMGLGECVVRANTSAVWSVLTSKIGSEAELETMKAIVPAIQQCLPAGETYGFDRMTLRGTVAIPYLQLGEAARATGALQ